MEVYVTDDQIGRYLRRVQLALRFTGLGARAHTTCEWSGLTSYQLLTVRRRSVLHAEEPVRGPSPRSFSSFFRSYRISARTALFVALCQLRGATRAVVSLENGERLCEAFEVFRAWQPDSDLNFEQAVLILIGAVRGENIQISRCTKCGRSLLIDKLAVARAHCVRCRSRSSNPAQSSRGNVS